MESPKATPKQPETLSQRSTAAILGVSIQVFQRMVAAGEAPPFLWIGKRRRWRYATVIRWLDQQEAAVARAHRAVTR